MGTAGVYIYIYLYAHTHTWYVYTIFILCVSQSCTTSSDGGGASFTPPSPSTRSWGVCREIRERGINANLIGVYFNIIPKVVRAYLCFVLGVCVCVCAVVERRKPDHFNIDNCETPELQDSRTSVNHRRHIKRPWKAEILLLLLPPSLPLYTTRHNITMRCEQ